MTSTTTTTTKGATDCGFFSKIPGIALFFFSQAALTDFKLRKIDQFQSVLADLTVNEQDARVS